MKIAMCTICKNEIENIESYLERNKDVDYICLLDTCSTDGTWEYLQKQSLINPKLIIQQKTYEQFSFGNARNDSFKLIPDDTDIVVMLDLDEYFKEDNWVDIIREDIKIDGKIHFYTTFYIDGSSYDLTDYSRTLIGLRIVQTKKFNWYYCVHEIMSDVDLDNLGNRDEENVNWNKLLIIHQPNRNKDRQSYISLCQRRIEEELPVKCDKEFEKYISQELLIFEYYRNNMYKEAIDLYNNELIKCKEKEYYRWLLFDIAPCMYVMTNNIQYLRDAISTLNNNYYEQHLLYYALRDDLEWCKQYKNEILQKIDEHNFEIPYKYKEYDQLGKIIEDMVNQL